MGKPDEKTEEAMIKINTDNPLITVVSLWAGPRFVRRALQAFSLISLIWLAGLGACPDRARAADSPAQSFQDCFSGGEASQDPQAFVDGNMDRYRRCLEALEEKYREKYGSDLLFSSQGNITALARDLGLPEPTTLKFYVGLPGRDWKSLIREIDEWTLSNIDKADQIFHEKLDLEWQLPGAYGLYRKQLSSLVDEGLIVAADEETANTLNLPREVGLHAHAELSGTGLMHQSCCINFDKTEGRCKKSVDYSPPSWIGSVDPRSRLQALGLKLETGPGAALIANNAAVRFSAPGTHTVTLKGRRGEPSAWENCLDFQYGYLVGKKRTAIKFKPGPETTAKATSVAVRFEKFGLPGLDFKAGEKPVLDYFFDAGKGTKGRKLDLRETDLARFPRPHVMVSAGGVNSRVLPCDRLPVSVNTKIVSPGPFWVDEVSRLNYIGGVGTTRISWTLGKFSSRKSTVQHAVTANLVNVRVDPDLEEGIAAAGAGYDIEIQVRGDADMTKFRADWSGGGVTWEKETTIFSRRGTIWVTCNTFLVPLGATAETVTFSAKVGAGTEIFSFSGNATLGSSAIEGLELYGSRAQETPRKLGEFETVDLFYTGTPKDLGSFRVEPMVQLSGFPSLRKLSDDFPDARVQILSSNPAAVRVGPGFKVFPGGAAPGTALVTGRIDRNLNPDLKDLQIAGDKAVSPPIHVTSNLVMLSVDASGKGQRAYKLSIVGPADMSQFRAVWDGEATRSTPFSKAGENFVASLSTTRPVDRVQIQKDGTPVAELSAGSALSQPHIYLIPPTPPMTTMKKTILSDTSNLETLGECQKEISHYVAAYGFDPGSTVDEYCRSGREEMKEEVKGLREKEKAQNQLVKELDKQGLEMVVFGDTMRVGAAVTGLPRQYWSRTFCRWSLLGGGGVELESEITPIQMSSDSLGATFNIVRGLKDGFDPATDLKVELLLDMSGPATPRNTSGGRYTGTASKE